MRNMIRSTKLISQEIEIPLNSFDSEKEFEKLCQGKSWIIGTDRGETYLEILKSYGYKLRSARVLDIGCGYGGVSLVFSKDSAEIISLDIEERCIRILKKRAMISNQKNIYVLLASADSLPLKDDCFDIALMIGVLEFLPRCNPFNEPQITHLNVFGGVKKILKKRGVFLLSSINRYWLGYWIGRKDFLTGIRFISILPRNISNYMYKIIKGKPYYLEQSYSYFEMNKILTKGNFNILKRFIGLPSCGNTVTLANVDDKNDVKQQIFSTEPWGPWKSGLLNIGFLPKVCWIFMNYLSLMKFFSPYFIYQCEVKDSESV